MPLTPKSKSRFFHFSLEEFTPKLWTLIQQGIPKAQFTQDLIAGIVVGIVALPLAIAFAIASGVSPEKGLITAILAGGLISLLGGSRVQIGGPTGAFIVIVVGIVETYGVDGLTVATFIAGLILLGFGLLRLGNLLKYIPHSLIVGFTSGIAIIIFSSQVKDFLGLHIDHVPSAFLDKWYVYSQSLATINPYAVGIAVFTVLAVLFGTRLISNVPGSLIAILVSTCMVQVFDLPVETIESKFGAIPNTLPMPSFPALDFQTFQKLLEPAFAIALLGGIESLLSAVVADGMIGARHRSNMELVAQGLANMVSGIFGGIPATGAIARTATNVKNGGRTPIAGITHALVLLAIMLLIAPYAKLIPLACLAGILVVVAYNMGEWHSFFSVLRGNRYDALVLVSTCLLTVLFDLILAIELGVVLAAFTFMKRMADIAQFSLVDKDHHADAFFDAASLDLPSGVVVYEISGPLFFGATQKFQQTLTEIGTVPTCLILRLRLVPFIDATGLYRLEEIVASYEKQGVSVWIVEAPRPVLRELLQHHVLHRSHIKQTLEEALAQIKTPQA